MTLAKENIAAMPIEEIELLFKIVGDLGYEGYRVSICKLHGNSYQQCANKVNLSRKQARCAWNKCVLLGHDIALKKLFGIK